MTTTIILPTLDEEEAIVQTIRDIKNEIDCPILVVDGLSTDDTVLRAMEFDNVEVISDYGDGKGAALRQAFEHCAPNNVIFVDADGTYQISKIGEFVKALEDRYETVVGEITYGEGVQPTILDIGMWDMSKYLWKTAFLLLYGRLDINNLSGFRGLSRRAIDVMNLQENGFGIETEIEAKTIRLTLTQKVIPIMYYKRLGESKLENSMWFNVLTKQWREIYWALVKYRFCKLV